MQVVPIVDEIDHAGVGRPSQHAASRLHDFSDAWNEIRVFVAGSEGCFQRAFHHLVHWGRRWKSQRGNDRAKNPSAWQIDTLGERTSKNREANTGITRCEGTQELR